MTDSKPWGVVIDDSLSRPGGFHAASLYGDSGCCRCPPGPGRCCQERRDRDRTCLCDRLAADTASLAAGLASLTLDPNVSPGRDTGVWTDDSGPTAEPFARHGFLNRRSARIIVCPPNRVGNLLTAEPAFETTRSVSENG